MDFRSCQGWFGISRASGPSQPHGAYQHHRGRVGHRGGWGFGAVPGWGMEARCVFSKKLSKAQSHYSTFDHKLLAMYLNVHHFWYFIEGRAFTLYTDHKPLTFAFASTSVSYSPHQQRHLAYVSEFTTDVRHIHGKDNLAADALSCVVLEEESPITSPGCALQLASCQSAFIDYVHMTRDQLTDTTVCTISYHPQSNGIVERFHRQLKASLKARLTGPNWTDELPFVLLGIRTSPKEDLGCSSAELVYGDTLRLPGEFFYSSNAPVNMPSMDFVTQLRGNMRRLRPTPTSHHSQQQRRTSAALPNCKYVFVRKDAHRTPLECPYRGPFRVLERAPKYYTLMVNGRSDMVSVDRLKPAHLDQDFGLQDGRPPSRLGLRSATADRGHLRRSADFGHSRRATAPGTAHLTKRRCRAATYSCWPDYSWTL